MIVMKFGGTSVGDARRVRDVAELIAAAPGFEAGHTPVAVVSAASGVTDLLIGTARAAASGDRPRIRSTLRDLQARVSGMVEVCVEAGSEREAVSAQIAEYLGELRILYTGVALLGELTPRSLDLIVSFGEKLSAVVVAGALRARGTPAEAVNADRFLITDDQFTNATPVMEATRGEAHAILLPLLDQGVVPVVTGFIGRTVAGQTTTLGRGGSDFSASILGNVLDADEIWIWTDVDGVMSADPRIVPHAQPLLELSYAEAAELSYFGAKVIHPRTVIPALEKRIPVRIKNTFNPAFPGTLIHELSQPSTETVKAVTSIRGLSLMTVQGAGMLGVPGVAARVFGAVARCGASVMMISQASSENNICFAIPSEAVPAVERELEREFTAEIARHDIAEVRVDGAAVIVAAVGAGMRGTPGVAARVFGAVARQGINIMAIAQGSSELNISCVLSAEDEAGAVRAIHDEFVVTRAQSGLTITG